MLFGRATLSIASLAILLTGSATFAEPQQGAAEPAMSPEQMLEAVKWGRAKILVDEVDRARVAGWFKKDARSAPRKTFELVLERRLALVDPAIRRDVLRFLKRGGDVVITIGEGIGASYEPRREGNGTGIDIEVPRGMRNSLTLYAMLIHETEHLIQDLLVRQHDSNIFVHEADREFELAVEDPAMTLEWNFYTVMPVSALEKEFKRLERARWANRIGSLQAAYREHLAAIAHARDSLATWKREQHRAGRYKPTGTRLMRWGVTPGVQKGRRMRPRSKSSRVRRPSRPARSIRRAPR